jgi:hypothetical protein
MSGSASHWLGKKSRCHYSPLVNVPILQENGGGGVPSVELLAAISCSLLVSHRV